MLIFKFNLIFQNRWVVNSPRENGPTNFLRFREMQSRR